ncbi:hypothetical protein HCN44_002477 [Aphidius gifuensis]|uniref:Uncharacterized protein n=1 Tax=Aphidius gifuensis TaxID=684658 RepID=A0A834Y2J1_APHGI|nr:cyclin-dependent kinase 2-interacting protein-like [Aphidius gifuensis]KAF7996831.1 hypothetical protein HCN44_002477 [Aphidius gifuensis]
MEIFSPAAASPKPIKPGELTGSSRVVKDYVADIHSCVQKWNDTMNHGVPLLKNIEAIKVDESFPNGLQEICDDLEKDVNRFNEIVCSLEVIVKQLRSVVKFNHGKEKLFRAWPDEYFVDAANLIYNSYRQEAIVKQTVLENVAHDHRLEAQMLHRAAWIHEPMIPYDLNKTLESMLIETGYK